MATAPKRRSTDPITGTKGPKRGDNDAFKQHMPKRAAPVSKPAEYKGGTGGRLRKQTRDDYIDSASGRRKN